MYLPDLCMNITLLGTMGGPGTFNGLAGSATLISYGTRSPSLSYISRGSPTKLTELGLRPTDIDALFITHTHSDHVDDLSVFTFYRWLFNGRSLDI
eukprot:Awhi_evm1s292